MITTKAARQLLQRLDAQDDAQHCYCDSDECTLDKNHLEDDGQSRPLLGIAFVTEAGELDVAANQEAYGSDHGDLISDAANAAIELRDYAEWIDSLVVIDRTSGQWWTGSEFPA